MADDGGRTNLMEQNINIDTTSSSESNRCPICLGPFLQESYLDRCFHKFCFNCILHWTNVVSTKNSRPVASVKCPLCKTDNFSIIHGYDGGSFQQYYLNNLDSGNSNFFSKAHKYRLQCYYIKPACTLSGLFDVSQYWKSRKYLQPNRWVFSWLRREIQALLQEEDVDIIVHHILGVIDSMIRNEQTNNAKSPKMTEQEEFEALVSKAARPFLGGRTDQFVKEVELFLASRLTIEAYDKVYIHHLGWKIPELTGEEADEEAKENEFQQHTPLVPQLYFFDDEDYGRTD